MLKPNGVLTDNAGELAAAFGRFFASIFRPNDLLTYLPTILMPELNISPTRVQVHLEEISVNKSAVPYEIYPQLLKILSPMLTEPFALLFNPSLDAGVISND